MWTVWLVASSWAPLVGLVMALADPPQERRTFLETLAANWDIVPFFLVRLGITYAAARKAFAARTRWWAVAWLAAGGAGLVAMLAGGAPPLTSDLTGSQKWEEWREVVVPPIALAAAWYGVLAAALYRPGGRSSYDQRDYGVALAGLWIAGPAIASHFALMREWLSEPADLVCRALVRTTGALFGHGNWFRTSFPDLRGLGEWIHSAVNEDALSGLQQVLASLLPAAVALGSLLRIVARRRWVHLVEAGRIPGWVLKDTTVQWPAGMPVLTGDGRGPVKVLARVRDAAGPYRAAEAEPVALVELPRSTSIV
jgi:hypothetical protein